MKRWSACLVLAISAVLSVAVVAQTAPTRPPSTVLQLMRSIFFTHGNVVFSAQTKDPEAIPRDVQSSLATNPLTGLYAGWQAIENSSLALADAVDLLNTPGRVCSNGRPAPVEATDWRAAVESVRTASLAAAAAARAKSQDRIFEVSEQMTDACASCHRIYRARGNPCVDARAQSPPSGN